VDIGYEDEEGTRTVVPLETVDGAPDDEWITPRVPTWAAARCGSCEQWSIWHNQLLECPRRATVGPPAHPDMPAHPKQLYQEAAAVAAVSRRASAALARATVERLLKEVDPHAPKRSTLEARIGRVRNRVSTPLAQMLDVVRVTGNDAVHTDADPRELITIALDDQEGPQLLELLLETANDLVDELITRPRTTEALWKKLPAGIKASIEAENGTGTGR
jgi:hypothetical protein